MRVEIREQFRYLGPHAFDLHDLESRGLAQALRSVASERILCGTLCSDVAREVTARVSGCLFARELLGARSVEIIRRELRRLGLPSETRVGYFAKEKRDRGVTLG